MPRPGRVRLARVAGGDGGYVVPVDGMEHGRQPRCPECKVVMRDIPGGWKCPACGHVEFAQFAQQPIDPDLPGIHGG